MKDYRNVTIDDILETEHLTVTISKKEVIENDLDKISYIFNLLKKCKKRGKQKLILNFEGFHDSNKEIFEIKEIRNFLEKVFNKYPYMFYFLSSVENNNKLILACLCEVEVIKDVEADKFFNDSPKIQILYNISIGVKSKIKDQTRNFALNIGEKEKQIDRFIKNFFKEVTTANNAYNPPNVFEMQRLINVYNEINKELWLGFIKDLEIKRFVKEKEIEDFIKIYKPYIDICITGNRYSTPVMVDIDTPSNVFVVSDRAYGKVCTKCGANTILVIKNALEDEIEALKDKIFLPSPENFIAKRISPCSKTYMTQIPVPVNIDTDKWYCLNCKELHTFSYDINLGFKY